MKKIFMAMVCLMTMTMSANAQNNIGIDYKFFHYDKFNDSMGLKLNAKTTILVEHVSRDIFELNMYREKIGIILGPTKLYSGNLNRMITYFNDILDKSKKWYKICVENNSPSLSKEINVDGYMFCYNNETHTYLVNFLKYAPNEFNEQDLIRILEYIKNFDASKYIEEEKNKEKEEEHRKKVLNLLN